jgi:Restriction endonuclease BglII
VQFDTFSYRHAEEILNSHLAIKRQINEVLNAVKEAPVKQGPGGLTFALMAAFEGRGWSREVPVSDKEEHEQRFDLSKERVAVEIEFSRYEFLYRDYLRFLSAYNADKIDVGVLITNADSGLTRTKHPSGAPSLARVQADLAWLRPTITVPIWVVALK